MSSATTDKYLFLMLGAPGSGKSYFAKNLAQTLGAVHLNSDAMRLAIFESREAASRIYHSDDRSVLNTYTFGAMNYAASSVLESGRSVIYDANNNTKQERIDTAQSVQTDGRTVVVWIQTPMDVAVQRACSRRESKNQRRLSRADAEEYISTMVAKIEAPDYSENPIIIDGTLLFEEQYASFERQLAEIVSE